MISQVLLDYIVEFLIGKVTRETAQGLSRPYSLIRYTDEPEQMLGAEVVIKPSTFFHYKTYGTADAEPILPLKEWEGIPLLFGEPRYEWINEGQTLLIHADLIASTYYLISRYEEMTHREMRDEFGRFPGKCSLPYRAGFVHRPIVDEYGALLRRLIVEHILPDAPDLRLSDRSITGFKRINLTHDVVRPMGYRGLKGLWQGLFVDKVSQWEVIRSLLRKRSKDPYRTFDQLFALDKVVEDAYPRGVVQPWLFLKVPSKQTQGEMNYRLYYRYIYEVLRDADKLGAKFGLLCSLQSSTNPHLIPEELKQLRNSLRRVYSRLYNWEQCRGGRHQNFLSQTDTLRDLDLISSRHSRLALGEPEDAREMLAAGIRHDYSMGYYDVAGFRLGTCRAVRFINPNTRGLTDLMMHPLTIMDTTLADADAMSLSEEEAYAYSISLIEMVRKYGGELTLSWHNDRFSPRLHPWLGSLYERLTKYLLYCPQK